MGAAPVLILLAAVGVDYGWHPDGTTSPQGDNIEYIVQIAPDQLQQLKSIGEITSTIDPAVQGRVSRIVVKIGTGPLPQDAGRTSKPALSVQNGSGRPGNAFADAADNIDIPRPQITGAVAPVQLASDPRGLASTSRNESLLKPDPQGFTMPDSVSSAGQSALDQVRTGVNNAGGQLEAQAKSALESVPGATKQAASDILNRAVDSVRTGINNNLAPNATGQPSTFTGAPNNSSFQFSPEASAAGRDNQWSDVSGRSGATTGVPSTDPVDPNSLRNAAWPTNTAAAPTTADPRLANDPRIVSDPRAVNDPRTMNDPRTFGVPGTSTAYGTASTATNANTGISNPATSPKSPSDPGWSGYGTSPTFGSAPAGVSLPANNSANYNQGNVAANPSSGFGNNSYPNTSGYANATPSTGNQPATDSGFYTNSNQPPFAHTASNWNTPSTQPNTNVSNTTAWPNSSSSTTSNPWPSTSPLANNTSAMEQTLAQQSEELKLMRAKMSSMEQQREKAQTNLVNLADDQVRSASDWANSAQARADRQAATNPVTPPVTYQPAKPRSVDAPKFFNFVLLLSLVGNAYLIFETNNLRRKFKNMISSIRTSKVGSQPATS